MSELDDAVAAYNGDNPFTSATHSLADSAAARHRLEAAQVAEWRCGRCCGEQGEHGECGSVAVRLARRDRLAGLGMRSRDARELSRTCEQSKEYAARFPSLREVETDEQRAEVWRVWAEMFIQEFETAASAPGDARE